MYFLAEVSLTATATNQMKVLCVCTQMFLLKGEVDICVAKCLELLQSISPCFPIAGLSSAIVALRILTVVAFQVFFPMLLKSDIVEKVCWCWKNY